MKIKTLFGLALLGSVSFSALAADVTGLWQTEPYKGITGGGGNGKYDQVRIHPCTDNAENICGTIENAFMKDGTANTENDFVGKAMLVDLKPKVNRKTKEIEPNKFSKGEILHPHMNKFFRSSIELDKDDPNVLHLDGCLAFFCMGQDWQRVE